MVKSCHGAAPSSLLCGLARLLWLDPTFGVISRCLCVYTYIPIDEKTCGFGRLLLLAVLKGLCRLWRPTDATNTSIPKQTAACEDDKAPRTSMTLAAFLLRDYDPKRLRTVWRRVALRHEVREFAPGSALSASSAAGVRPGPSADSMLRMVAACLGSTAPSTRHTVNHLLFNS